MGLFDNLTENLINGQTLGGGIRGFFFLSDWISQKFLEIAPGLNPQAVGAGVSVALIAIIVTVLSETKKKLFKWVMIALIVWALLGFVTN